MSNHNLHLPGCDQSYYTRRSSRTPAYILVRGYSPPAAIKLMLVVEVVPDDPGLYPLVTGPE